MQQLEDSDLTRVVNFLVSNNPIKDRANSYQYLEKGSVASNYCLQDLGKTMVKPGLDSLLYPTEFSWGCYVARTASEAELLWTVTHSLREILKNVRPTSQLFATHRGFQYIPCDSVNEYRPEPTWFISATFSCLVFNVTS